MGQLLDCLKLSLSNKKYLDTYKKGDTLKESLLHLNNSLFISPLLLLLVSG